MKRRLLLTLTLLVALAAPVAVVGGTSAYGVSISYATVNPDRSVTIDWALENPSVSTASVMVDWHVVTSWTGRNQITRFRTAPLAAGWHTITVDAVEWFESYTRSGASCVSSGSHWVCNRSWRRSIAVQVPSATPAGCLVPDVVGLPVRDAKARITRAWCTVGAVTRVPAHRTAGTVLAQRPKPKGRFRFGAPISLVVSDGDRSPSRAAAGRS